MRLAGEFSGHTACQQRLGADAELAAVASLYPARVAFETHRARASGSQPSLRQDQLHAVGVQPAGLAVDDRVVLDRTVSSGGC